MATTPHNPGAETLFFPAAAFYAAVVVPLWLGTNVASAHPLPRYWHGHEMLFGYLLAVVAGFLVPRSNPLLMWLLFGAWLIARAAAFAPVPGWVAPTAAAGFSLMLLGVVLPPLLRGAKRWRNRILPMIIALLVALQTGLAVQFDAGHRLPHPVLLAAVDAFAALVLIVGGRALPAAIGNLLEQRGLPRDAAAGNVLELPVAVAVLVAAGADAAGCGRLAGALSLVGAVLNVTRMRRWHLTRCGNHPQVWALALGYVGLTAALVLKGLVQLHGNLPVTPVLHALMVCGLAPVTMVMMARTSAVRGHRSLDRLHMVAVAAVLVVGAGLLRTLAWPTMPLRASLLWSAAFLWSGGYLILGAWLLIKGGHGGNLKKNRARPNIVPGP